MSGYFGNEAKGVAYAKTGGHGDNLQLKKLIAGDPKYAQRNFQWSILEVLPLNITNDQAIERENLNKQKLMSRAPFGYNEN